MAVAQHLPQGRRQAGDRHLKFHDARHLAWDLGTALDWAHQRAAAKGFAGVTVSCEPTGHRWRVLAQLAADRSMPFVCVQPAVSSWSRRAEDLTHDKTDEKDAVLIARLTVQLRCYEPEPVDETWGRLRHLGARREQLITEISGQIQQMRDLLECVWPAALDAAQQPFRSRTWIAALTVIVDRDGGQFDRTRRLGLARFEQAVCREISKRGGQKPCRRITRGVFAALSDPAGVIAHRAGALERVQLLLEDWQHAHDRLTDTETRMIGVLDELELTALVTSITGISAVGAAAILAQTGDPRRFTTARALVKHAGLAPREKLSGTFTGRTKLTGQGRPGLRRRLAQLREAGHYEEVWHAREDEGSTTGSSVKAPVRMSHETGKPNRAGRPRLGVNEGTLGNWVIRDRAGRQGTDGCRPVTSRS